MSKRLFDIVVVSIGLLFVGPLLAAIALIIQINSGGPIFYRGVRVGHEGHIFRIFKFRTMVVNAQDVGASSTGDDDPRITPLGRLLRRYKLDELPQLFNVFIGDMSLVGPRPQVQWAVDLYTSEKRALLLSVRPGITDYASLLFRDEGAILRGSADPDRDYLEKIEPEKIRLGLAYVKHHCVFNDIKIIVATLGAIVGIDPAWCLAETSFVQNASSQAPNRR